MKNKLFITLTLLAIILTSIANVNAQQPNATAKDVNDIVINPSMPIVNIIFAIKALNTITIQGAEVDAFLEAKGILEKEINRCAELKKKTNETTSFSVTIGKAQIILDFLKRAKLTGGDANYYQGFVQAFVDASKKVNPNNK